MFAAYVLVMTVATVVCALVPAFRRARSYAWRALVYPSVGCIVANIPVVFVIVLAGRLNNSELLTQPESTIQKQLAEFLVMAAFFGILGGCALAGAIGFVFGALLGMERAARASLLSDSPAQ